MGLFGDAFSGIGAGIGALLGGSSGGSRPAGSTTVTTAQDIPEWLKPFVTANLSGAQATRDQLTGTNNGLMNLAVPGYAATLRGDYLDPNSNPWLKSTFNTSADLVNSRINSIFEGGNRYGSGQQAGAIGTADTALANQIYGGNYQAERARQAAAIGGLPGFNLQSGQAAMQPYSSFASLTPGLTTGATTSPYFSNPLGSALSGALAGGVLGGAGGLPDVSSILKSLGISGTGGAAAGANMFAGMDAGTSAIDALLSMGGEGIPFFL
jgi:hypothetical protein